MNTKVKRFVSVVSKINNVKSEDKNDSAKTGSGLQKLIDFLIFIRDNHLEEMARENMKNLREMNIPLMRLFAHMPEEALLQQSMKGMRDNVDNLQNGTYIEKQKLNLKLWEEDKLPGIPRESITPTDLVMIYAVQKKGYFKFLPLYTTDNHLTIEIMQALDELNLTTQNEAFSMMFRLSKEAEEKSRRSSMFLDSVLENLPNMVFVKDAKDLRFVRFNKAGEQLLGFTKQDMMGKNDYDFFPKDQADFFTSNDRAVLNSNNLADIAEEEINTKSGKRWLHTRKISIKDEKGNPIYLLGISEDITGRREKEEKIKKLNRELSKNIVQLGTVNKELEAFSYSVSHDLRAPLRAIHGYTKILLDSYREKLDEDGKHMMDSVMSNAVKMGQLIDDLLAFSRMGKKEMNIGAMDMTEAASNALKLIKSTQEGMLKANITIHPLLPISADYGLVELVFTNLISNAIKYSSKVDKPTIEVNSYSEEGENVYYVKDNGVGFDMKYYDKLFGVFQRLHSVAEFDGTGVGLALVKRIISRHGGKVWAEAEPGKGATFYFSLFRSK